MDECVDWSLDVNNVL